MSTVISSPLNIRSIKFHLKGCKWEIKKPIWKTYAKLNPDTRTSYLYVGYVGELLVAYKCRSKRSGKTKLRDLLQVQTVGKFQNEGCGQIKWLNYSFAENRSLKDRRPTKQPKYKLKIRKGIPQNLHPAIKDLVRYGLLHDFYICLKPDGTRYPSKIYLEPKINNKILFTLLKLSHAKPDHILVNVHAKYDGLAASITRREKSPRNNRYNWKQVNSGLVVDFHQLTEEIGNLVDNFSLNRLYHYIHQSVDLDLLNESFRYGHTSLKTHLLLIANLIIRDYCNGRLENFIEEYSTNYLHYRHTRNRTLVQE